MFQPRKALAYLSLCINIAVPFLLLVFLATAILLVVMITRKFLRITDVIYATFNLLDKNAAIWTPGTPLTLDTLTTLGEWVHSMNQNTARAAVLVRWIFSCFITSLSILLLVSLVAFIERTIANMSTALGSCFVSSFQSYAEANQTHSRRPKTAVDG